ncbi:MAG: GAF domain-containing protein, partial [Anaerolineae bacterium]
MKLPRISTDQRVALLYAAFGGLWIALSDRILATLARDVAALTIMQTYKGWAFVVISAALIYSLLRRDLALRNRAENTLRASERAYQTLANISPVGIFRADPDGATTYVNPMWSEITGLLQDKALGDGWLAAVHPDDQEKLRRDWQESTAQQKPSFSDYRFVRSDGTMAWVMGQATPEIAADGQITGYVGTITDITERKQHEEAVHRRAEEFAALYEVGRETTAQTDLPRLLETITQQSARLLKSSDATIYLYDAAKDELELAAANAYALPRGSRFPVSQGISGAVIRERQAKIVDDYRTWSSRRPELQHVDLRAVALVPLIHREEIIGVLAVAEIGNDRKYTAADTRLLELLASQAASAIQNARLRAELETYNRELEARVAQRTEELSDALLQAQDADRLKSVFLATMSHELRTPLNSIIGFSGILLQGLAGPLNAEQSKQLGMVRDSARHLLALINDVLDISKIEAGQLRVERAPFAMRSVIE